MKNDLTLKDVIGIRFGIGWDVRFLSVVSSLDDVWVGPIDIQTVLQIALSMTDSF